MPPRVDFTTQRLFVEAPLAAGAEVVLSAPQAHYLLTVLRMETGSKLLVFNGKDGEWRAEVTRESKRAGRLVIGTQTRPQPPSGAVWLAFAPIRKERLAFLVEKAVEMGASRLLPVITEHTQNPRLKMDRLRATVIEAAEQCGVLSVPDLDEAVSLDILLSRHDPDHRTLVFCDEQAENINPIKTLSDLPTGQSIVLVLGPEGGFSAAERRALMAVPRAKVVALGPRILRAETAVVAALTLAQLTCGDWNPDFTTRDDCTG